MPDYVEILAKARRYWLVPSRALRTLDATDLARMVADADEAGTLRDLARALSLDADTAEAIARALVQAFERGELVAIEGTAEDHLDPILPGPQQVDWDDLPSLTDLRPKHRDDPISPAPVTPLVSPEYLVTEILLDGYAQGASVLRWGGMRPRSDQTTATARAALRVALWNARGRHLAIAGHADPLGQDDDNVELSRARATSLHLFATGQLDEWAAHAFAHANDVDLACALVACHRILGLGVASIDDGPRKASALSAVRNGAGLPSDGPITTEDWVAFAELYEVDLAALLLTDRAGLADLRRTITFTDPPLFAIGEQHPRSVDELVDLAGPEAPAQRRTSLLVFSDAAQTAPALGSDCSAVYDGTYLRTILRVPGEALVDILVKTVKGDPIASGRAWIDCGELGASLHHAGADGHIRFTTLVGDRIEVVAASFAVGGGAMVDTGLEGV